MFYHWLQIWIIWVVAAKCTIFHIRFYKSLWKEVATVHTEAILLSCHILIRNVSRDTLVQEIAVASLPRMVNKAIHAIDWFTASSVTRLGDFLHFGQPCKTVGDNYIFRIFLKMDQTRPLFAYFRHFSTHWQIKYKFVYMVCLGLEPGAAGW